MKNRNILYWIVTGLFVAFMLLSAIPEIMGTPDGVNMIIGLGYPAYFIPFLGVAKLLGIIAILIPGFPRIKEWAYAGLFFDLTGATYSIIVKEGLRPDVLFMILPIGFLFWSYFLYQKRRRLINLSMNIQ